jgi:pimeloyl-ACP methyl ester carboxylesterase
MVEILLLMRNLLLLLCLLFIPQLLPAQTNQAVPVQGLYLEGYKYPYTAETYNFSSQRQKLFMGYMDVKPDKPNGKTVVLLHGKNFNGAYWGQTAERLVKEGFRVIIPDQVGFGKSAKPTNYQYTFQQLATNTKGLLDSLGVKKAVVLGHSMGGMLAARFALMFPQFTQKLVLVNPIGLEDWKKWVPYQPVEYWYQQEMSKDYQAIKDYQLKSYYDGKWQPKYDAWVEVLAGWTKNPDYHKIAYTAALTYDMIFTQPVVYELDQLSMPTLLIIGQRDKTALGKNLVDQSTAEKMGNYPELGKQAAQKIPNAQLVPISDIGHLPHIEAFDKFISPLVDFLNK